MAGVSEEFRQHHGKGLPDAELARHFGRSVSWALRMRGRLKLKRNPAPRPTRLDPVRARRLHADGLVDQQIADRLGVSRELVQKWRTKNKLAANGWRRGHA